MKPTGPLYLSVKKAITQNPANRGNRRDGDVAPMLFGAAGKKHLSTASCPLAGALNFSATLVDEAGFSFTQLTRKLTADAINRDVHVIG